MRLTAPQMQLAKKVMKSGKRGLPPHDMNTATLEALLERQVVAYRGDNIVLIAPTRKVLRGRIISTVLDLDDSSPRTASFDMGVGAA